MAAVPATDDDFYVVGIGASAGGLTALRTLFSAMPPEPGYACVVVVHLSPEHESNMVELLQPYSPMPVQQVRQTVALKPNHVYVIPPNANLNAIDTHLRLSELEANRLRRAAVDHFLRTLAATHDGRAVGVILTGAGSDGSLGIRLIKECGGLTIAQDPHEAEFDSMPRSAITTGTVDLVLPARRVAEEIARYCGTRPQLPVRGDHAAAENPEQDRAFDDIVDELRRRTGQDFSVYRRSVVLRRVRHRMQLRHLDSPKDYVEVLRSDLEEARALQSEVLLHVTEFFAEAALYRALEQRVLPALFAGQPPRVRVWSIGCSTGEEAYSLAMLLIEQSERVRPNAELQIFASDISDDALQRSRMGLYPQEVAATVSSERRARFFVHEGDQFQIRKEVRDCVLFTAHDLFKDPPFAHLNLIVCRNLLHELQPQVRMALLNLFFYALEEGGYLVVGPKDVVDAPQSFIADEAGPRIYRRRAGTRREAAASWLNLHPFARAIAPSTGLLGGNKPIDELYRSAIERYAPPTVLIDESDQVLRFSTAAHRYIRLPAGDFTNELSRLLPEAIRLKLAEGRDEVRKTGRAWASEEFVAEVGRVRRQLVLRIDPLGNSGPHERLLVIFDERLPPPSRERSGTQVSGLDAELQPTDARVEALLSAAGDAPASGVRAALRPILEELQASREELRTVKEELTALDSESRSRISELARTSDDLRNILESTEVATLVLDEKLRVIRITEPAAKLLHLTRHDVGQPLREAVRTLTYDGIEVEAERVIAHETRVDRELRDERGRWYLSRMLPYRAAGRGVEGVVISFIDITDRKRAEQALRSSEEQQRLTVQLVPALLWRTDAVGKDVSVNFQWKAFTGQDDEQVQDFGWLAALHPDEREASRAAFKHAFLTGEPLEREQRIRRIDGEYRWYLFRQVPVRDESGAVVRWFGAAIDINESRQLQDRQRTLLAELHHRTRNLITVVQALSDRTAGNAVSLEDFRDRFKRRLAALSRVQGLLSHLSAGERVTFDQLLTSELSALGAPDDKVTLAGPAGVPLRSVMVQILALAIHELATNAVKYGALSPSGGHLDVRWHVEAGSGPDDAVLQIEWRESGVKMPDAGKTRQGGGYGRELIERALPYQLKAQTSYSLGPDGIRCTIAVPVSVANSAHLIASA